MPMNAITYYGSVYRIARIMILKKYQSLFSGSFNTRKKKESGRRRKRRRRRGSKRKEYKRKGGEKCLELNYKRTAAFSQIGDKTRAYGDI